MSARYAPPGRPGAGATGFLGVEVGLYVVPFTSTTEAVIVGIMPGLPAAGHAWRPVM